VGAYAQSKWRDEQAITSAGERGLCFTVLRLATVFGRAPVMRFDAVANRFAYLAGVGRPLTVFGSGEQIRPLFHVRDASSALRFCLVREAETTHQVYNVAGVNASVLDLVEAIRKAKPGVRVHYTEQDVLTHLSFSVETARFEQLGWRPQYSFDEGLAEVLSGFEGIQSVPLKVLNGEDNF